MRKSTQSKPLGRYIVADPKVCHDKPTYSWHTHNGSGNCWRCLLRGWPGKRSSSNVTTPSPRMPLLKASSGRAKPLYSYFDDAFTVHTVAFKEFLESQLIAGSVR
jgi:hypothetical protein